MFAAMSSARSEDSGLASGLVDTSYQIGSALGLGVMTVIALSHAADQVGDASALTAGFRTAFIGTAAVAAAGAALMVVLIGRRNQHPATSTSVDHDDLVRT